VTDKANSSHASRLHRGQKRLLVLVVALGVIMLADTLYLLVVRLAGGLGIDRLAVAGLSLPRVYQVMLVSHTGVGLVLVLLALAFVEWHLPAVWRRSRVQAIVTGAVTVLLGLGLAVTGLFILSEANSRDNAWAWWCHVAAAAGLPVFYLAHRRLSLWKPSPRSYRTAPAALAGVALVALALHGLSGGGTAYTEAARQAMAAGSHRGPGSPLRDLEDLAGTDFVPASFVPYQSPFFPAATTTTTGAFLPSRIITRGDLVEADLIQVDIDKYGFAVENPIGVKTCARCHADVAAQWAASAHRFASFNNPFYEASINLLRARGSTANDEVRAHIAHFASGDSAAVETETGDQSGTPAEEVSDGGGFVRSKWCSGCHDPALMLAGKMSQPIDRRTPQAQAGLTCLACHAIDRIHNVTGNGNYNIADEQEDPYLFPEAQQGITRLLHDAALKARPEVHKQQMLKPFFRTGEFCATCHKVSVDRRLNDYRWLRGQDEYDNWHDSGVSGNASRTFYLPQYGRQCRDCHMPLEPAILGDVSARDGLVRSHRFAAVNTALPFLRGDVDAMRRAESFLRGDKLRVEIFGLRRESGLVECDVGSKPARVAPGETVSVEVVVRNRGVGHTFPGGTTDSNEAWLELSVLDGDGRVLGRSGAMGRDGHVDAGAHFYRAVLVDADGQLIHQRNVQDVLAPVYVRVIGPGAADVAHYRFAAPASSEGSELVVRARLLWRKFDRRFTEFAYQTNRQGFAGFDTVPDLPVTEIATDEVRLAVGDASAAGEGAPASRAPGRAQIEAWERYNDYGIGLLLQGDTRGAAAAFHVVAQRAPERPDGLRNLARAALEDGDLNAAYEYLGRCEALAPGDGQTAWVWGVAHQKAGRYDEAELAFCHVLETFPDDRAAWRRLGRVLYLDGRFDEAAAALDEVLRIDPEDRVAHYHRMLALRALGREAEALVAEAAYQHYQIDESAQEVTLQYRREHEHDNREAQAIHIHDLALSDAGGP